MPRCRDAADTKKFLLIARSPRAGSALSTSVFIHPAERDDIGASCDLTARTLNADTRWNDVDQAQFLASWSDDFSRQPVLNLKVDAQCRSRADVFDQQPWSAGLRLPNAQSRSHGSRVASGSRLPGLLSPLQPLRQKQVELAREFKNHDAISSPLCVPGIFRSCRANGTA